MAEGLESTPIQKPAYREVLSGILANPHADSLWNKAISLARSEEFHSPHENFYSHVPLNDLIAVGERLKATTSMDEHYRILSDKASTGERFYDVVLGHANDKAFAPVEKELKRISNIRGKWTRGLDTGTGTGNTLRAMAPYFDRITGVDRFGDVLQREKDEHTLPANSDILIGDATSLPFDKNTFDIAASNGLSYYLTSDNMQKYITEVSRVLIHGGLYFEGVAMQDPQQPLPGYEMEYLQNAKGLLICVLDHMLTENPGHNSPWDFGEIIDTFDKMGFSHEVSRPDENNVLFLKFQKLR